MDSSFARKNRNTRRRTSLFACGALALFAGLTPPAGAQFEDDDRAGGQLFWLPESADAGRKVAQAERHFGAGDWSLGVGVAQELLEGLPGELLPERRDPDRPSQSAHHLGVAEWARTTLRGLPRPGLDAYEERFGTEAGRALVRARELGTAEALLDVAARFPAAVAAERALWAAGDVFFSDGHLDDAGHAWGRAAELARARGRDAAEAALERRRSVAEGFGDGRGPTNYRLPGPGEAPGPVPTEVSESWMLELPANPFTVSRASLGFSNLVPLVHGERVYLSTTLEVLAVDGFTGEELWRSPRPTGWDGIDAATAEDLAEAVDRESQLVAPAIGSGIVVAALQIPFAHLPNDDFQGFVITRPLPDRRLFAFDARTGRPLWDHEPPPGWDGNSGSFVERMSVSGSPVIAGGRVLVPMSRMDGRVDLHLAAFDLVTGELEWSTPIVSGQRELNMFNRHEREFSAPPVRVEGDTVLLLTQLGSLAAVDLLTGDTRWQAVYEQIPLPGNVGLVSMNRQLRWKNAPPVVADGVVLATPIDSDQLVAFDLADGRVLWSTPWRSLIPRGRDGSSQVDVLLGAGEDEVVLGGTWLVSWRKPQGLDSWAKLVPGGLREELGTDVATSSTLARRAPRATLGSDRVLVPGRTELLMLDRDRGTRRPEASIDWVADERGNVTVGPGALYVASNEKLRGLLDLSVLERRALARADATPGDPEAVRELGSLLLRRARLHFEAGRTSDALSALERARARLEPLADASGEVLDVLIANLREEARIRRAAGSVDAALARLARGLELARTPEQIRDLRLDQLPIVRTRDPEAWSAALDDLATRAGSAPLRPSVLAPDPDWLGFVGGPSDRLVPVDAAAWVAVQRGLQAEARGRFSDALESWHRLLDEFRNRAATTDRTLGELAEDRIGRLLELGGRQLYAPWEGRAERELERALAAGDRAGLESLPERYPFAEAGLRARRALVDDALAEGDVERLAASVGELLQVETDPLEQLRLQAMLAVGIGSAGNRAYERALLERVRDARPELGFERGPLEGERIEDLLRARPRSEPRAPSAPSFGPELERVEQLEGEWLLLGQPPVDAGPTGGDTPRPVLVARGESLEARASDGSNDLLWRTRLTDALGLEPLLRRPELWEVTGTRVVLGALDRLVAVDVASGRVVWSREVGPGNLESLCSTDGVLVAHTTEYELEGATHLIGHDPVSGAELWRRTLPDTYSWWPPIAAEGRLVALAVELDGRNRAAVLDPFTGRLRAILDVPDRLGTRADRLPWIEADRLILPSMYTERLTAFDLARLEVAWTYEVEPESDLQALLQAGSKLYLHTVPDGFGRDAVRGELIEIDPRVGSHRTIHTLDRGESLAGVRPRERTRLEVPYVFAVASEDGRRTRLSAIDLGRGRRWVQELDLRPEQFYDVTWARAGLSETTVALFYAQRLRRAGERHRVWLDVFDLRDGTRRLHREVRDGYTGFDRLEAHAFGPTLWVAGEGARGVEDRIDLWSDR